VANGRQSFKGAVYEQFARIGKAISNPARLELLELLSQGPRNVEALAKEAGLGLPNTSQQLKVLREARLVSTKKNGLYVTYRLADEQVSEFFLAVRSLAQKRLQEIAEITRTFIEAQESLRPVDRKQLLERIRSDSVTVLDVRPSEEYSAGHLSRAVSIPLKELKRRLADLPRNRDIVAYCRGPYCVMAIDAVKLLRRHGFTAYRLEDGVQEFRAMGFWIASGGGTSESAGARRNT
jgi:rhodanese-related sulfurtransferase